jgi:hypothetical protein
LDRLSTEMTNYNAETRAEVVKMGKKANRGIIAEVGTYLGGGFATGVAIGLATGGFGFSGPPILPIGSVLGGSTAGYIVSTSSLSESARRARNRGIALGLSIAMMEQIHKSLESFSDAVVVMGNFMGSLKRDLNLLGAAGGRGSRDFVRDALESYEDGSSRGFGDLLYVHCEDVTG